MATNGQIWAQLHPELGKLLGENAIAPRKAAAPPKRETKYGKRHVPGQMNKTESEFADLLELRKTAGDILDWHFEAMTFKLAQGCRFTPDFLIVHFDHVEFVDVKGGGPIDQKAIVKLKCAAEKFTMFRFSIEQKIKGRWLRREF